MGKLVRRTLEGDKTVAEWSAGDGASVRAAEEAMRRRPMAAELVKLWNKAA